MMNIRTIFENFGFDTEESSSVQFNKKISKASFNEENSEVIDEKAIKEFYDLLNSITKIQTAQQNRTTNDKMKSLDLLSHLNNLSFENKNSNLSRNCNNMRILTYLNDVKFQDKKSKIKLDSFTENDMKSIKEMIQNPNLIINQMNQNNFQMNMSMKDESGQISYKTFEFSQSVFDMIEKSYKNQKPLRLDFDGNLSVILKIDKEGKISAEFLSGSKAMESILKDSLPHLKNKFDEEGIAYKDITYRDKNQKQKNNEDKGG